MSFFARQSKFSPRQPLGKVTLNSCASMVSIPVRTSSRDEQQVEVTFTMLGVAYGIRLLSLDGGTPGQRFAVASLGKIGSRLLGC